MAGRPDTPWPRRSCAISGAATAGAACSRRSVRPRRCLKRPTSWPSATAARRAFASPRSVRSTAAAPTTWARATGRGRCRGVRSEGFEARGYRAEIDCLSLPTPNPSSLFPMQVGGVHDAEADLHRHLVVLHLALGDLAANRDDFEPVQAFQLLRGAGDRVLDRRVYAVFRGADQIGRASCR